MRIAVAVSGGVDSLCALLRLSREGHEVLALHGLFLPDATADGPTPDGLRAACRKLGLEFHIADLRDRFRQDVMEPFAAAYARGETPNPCALCNQSIKFGALQDAAAALGADLLATGHYARLAPAAEYNADWAATLPASPGRPPVMLAAGADAAKDQSYFLALVPPRRLQRAHFPLERRTKAESVAEVAAAALATPVPDESQEICFIPASEDAYRDFLRRRWAAQGLPVPPEGPVMLEDGREIGRHHGLWQYTEGQRKGLGIAWSEPLYVLRKDRKRNILFVGPRNRLGMRACRARQVVLHVPPRFWPDEVLARVRHRQRPSPARTVCDGTSLRITPHEPQFPGAPGQIAAVYGPQGHMLAGGILDRLDLLSDREGSGPDEGDGTTPPSRN